MTDLPEKIEKACDQASAWMEPKPGDRYDTASALKHLSRAILTETQRRIEEAVPTLSDRRAELARTVDRLRAFISREQYPPATGSSGGEPIACRGCGAKYGSPCAPGCRFAEILA